MSLVSTEYEFSVNVVLKWANREKGKALVCFSDPTMMPPIMESYLQLWPRVGKAQKLTAFIANNYVCLLVYKPWNYTEIRPRMPLFA